MPMFVHVYYVCSNSPFKYIKYWAHSEPFQTSKTECFVKIANGFLPALAERSIFDIWQGSEYTSVNYDSRFYDNNWSAIKFDVACKITCKPSPKSYWSNKLTYVFHYKNITKENWWKHWDYFLAKVKFESLMFINAVLFIHDVKDVLSQRKKTTRK